MATIVIMPKQGLQMTEGTIISWFKKVGDEVQEGEPLFSMETDKLTIDIDATTSGTLLKIIAPEGAVVPITEPIAVIGEAGEDISALLPSEKADAPAEAAPAEPAVAAPAASNAPAGNVVPDGCTVVIMPKQGLQMTEGTIISWFKQVGDEVKEGEPLFSMETDKLEIDIDATASGTLLKILAEPGDVIPITEPIALIGPAGTDVTAYTGKAAPSAAAAPVQAEAKTASAPMEAVAPIARKAGERVFITPRARMTAKNNGIDYMTVAGTGPDGLIIERDILTAIANKPKATPVAAKLAELEGVDLKTISGSGVGGKIMKDDVLNAMKPAAEAAPAAPAAKETAAPVASEDETVIPIKGMRKAIFDNMMKSLHGMAQANHRMKVDMTECKRLREALKAEGVKVSFNDILMLAATKALLKYPCINATVLGDNIIEKHYTNIGLAVAVPNGLMVPNVKHTEKMSLTEIAKATAEQIAKTRDNKLTMADYSGGTFTITNLGMFDVDEFTPVINAPEAAILGVGKIADTPVVKNGEIVARPIMTLSLTYDHRIVNGAPAAEFLQYLKKLLENPYLML